MLLSNILLFALIFCPLNGHFGLSINSDIYFRFMYRFLPSPTLPLKTNFSFLCTPPPPTMLAYVQAGRIHRKKAYHTDTLLRPEHVKISHQDIFLNEFAQVSI